MKRLVILFCFLCSALPAAAMTDASELAAKGTVESPSGPEISGDTQGYSGTTVGGSSWDRPFADGTCCSGLGPVVYQTQAFWVSDNATCAISSTQDGWDGYLFVYADPFDPSNQTVNFIAGDDDGLGGIGTSDIESVNLTGGVLYQLVTTGFAAGDEGTFTNSITCDSTVHLGATVIPTLSEWAMWILMAGMVASAGYFGRRRLQL